MGATLPQPAMQTPSVREGSLLPPAGLSLCACIFRQVRPLRQTRQTNPHTNIHLRAPAAGLLGWCAGNLGASDEFLDDLEDLEEDVAAEVATGGVLWCVLCVCVCVCVCVCWPGLLRAAGNPAMLC